MSTGQWRAWVTVLSGLNISSWTGDSRLSLHPIRQMTAQAAVEDVLRVLGMYGSG